jgi:HEAT repeat protein
MDLSNYIDDLNNPDPGIRASSIIALGKTEDKNAAVHLTRILKNKNEIDWLRGCAAIALSRIPGEESIPPLIEALQDENLLVSRAAILALGDLKYQPAIPYLEEILQSQDKKELHAAAITILGTISGREAAQVLLQALENPDNRVKRNAALALGELHIEKAVIPLMNLMKEDDECLRAIAASSLGLIGDKQAVEALIIALSDISENVRTIAASSLGYLGDSKSIPLLEKALQDENKSVRETAGAALLKLKSHEKVKKGALL